MLTRDFDYELPEGAIAQQPLPRGTSRLLVLDRRRQQLDHRTVADLPALLSAGDLMVVNDTRVIPARLFARRGTGRRFEVLLLHRRDREVWEALLRPSSRARPGEPLELADGGHLIPEELEGEGRWTVRCDPPLELARLEELGEPPLPPYIRRPDGATVADRFAYQTVYADRPGAVAAPTAGLHFTDKLLDALAADGVEIVRLTLHVGIGTFRPVAAEVVEDHTMHVERYEVPPATAAAVNRALAGSRRIVCVGTTCVRALESGLAAGGGRLAAGAAESSLFITPGYRFLGVGALLTNFHLPRSSLIMLVSAFAGRERVLDAYREALSRGYRFFSYGDAMLIV